MSTHTHTHTHTHTQLEDALRPVGGLDVVQREAKLLAFYQGHGLDADAQAAQSRLFLMTGVAAGAGPD